MKSVTFNAYLVRTIFHFRYCRRKGEKKTNSNEHHISFGVFLDFVVVIAGIAYSAFIFLNITIVM